MIDSAASAARSPAPVPAVRVWRRRARRARREHHDRSAGDVFNDLYALLWFFLIYGSAFYSEVRRALEVPGVMEGAVERHWLGIAALLAGAGLVWQGLRALGPMLASPAEQYWAVSSPMSRRGWLVGRFVGVLAGGAVLGAMAAFTVVLLGIRGSGSGSASLAGALYGTAVAALSVAAQRARVRRRWPDAVGAILLGAGGITALGVIAAHYTGRAVAAPAEGVGPVLLAAGVPLAGVSVWRATRALSRLDRARLGAGAQLAAAVVTSAVWMDVTVLGGVLEVRRWRRVGRVRSRHPMFRIPGVPDRVWVLVQAEALRTLRRSGALGFWAALALTQYGVAVAAPSLAGVARLILAYLAVGRLMPGLRAVARSVGLRRSLGGSEAELRVAHVVVPALAGVLWWGVTIPAGTVTLDAAGLLLVAGVVAAAYRSATRGPIDYSEAIVETGVGQLPVGLILQLARGPDLLGAAILVRVLMG